jgi:hypothetical protein
MGGNPVDDVIVGAYLNDSADGSITDAGAAYIFNGGVGASGTTNAESADQKLYGKDPYEYFGFSVCNASDVDNNNFDDVLVGAPGNDSKGTDSGVVYVYHGNSVTSILNGNVSGSLFGFSVSSAGDVNEDGIDDILIGAPGADSRTGRAYIYTGKTLFNHTIIFTDDFEYGPGGFNPQWTASPLSWSITSGNPRSGADSASTTSFGSLTTIAIDLSSYDDVALEFWMYLTIGGTDFLTLEIYDGSSWNSISRIDASNGVLGAWNYFKIDVDKELNNNMITNFQFRFNAFLLIGNTAYVDDVTLTYNITPTSTLFGEGSGDQFGYSVSCLGDINNDNIDDFVVGAPFNDNGGSDAGAIYVFNGTSTSLPFSIFASNANYTETGSTAGERLGHSVGAARYFDKQTYAVVLAGAPFSDPNSKADSGKAYLYSLIPEYPIIFLPFIILALSIYFNKFWKGRSRTKICSEKKLAKVFV